ncbi:E3 SUMO-protein ligase SIZ1-like protein [Drosera capensis]
MNGWSKDNFDHYPGIGYFIACPLLRALLSLFHLYINGVVCVHSPISGLRNTAPPQIIPPHLYSIKEKLADFRTKELKDVLSRAGITKQGKKQDLVDRIVALLYDEGTPGVLKKLANGKDGLVEIIEDVYRKMQNFGARDSTLKKQNSPGTSGVEVKEEAADSSQPMMLRCPCGSTFPADALIQASSPFT